MPYLCVGEEDYEPVEIYYEDHGQGSPVVLIHGFPLSGRSWERQVTALLAAGHRVITYDRRGFGESSRPIHGYDYDTLANDLHQLLVHVGLFDVALVGMSMGGGEVVRYLATFGSARVRKAVIISGVPPFLLKTPDNPDGVDRSVFDGIQDAIRSDRLAYLTQFLADFYNLDTLLGKRISTEVVRDSWNIASGASPAGTLACVPAWLTDFRKDLPRVNVPTLLLHGDQDRILPIAATARKTHEAVQGSELLVVKGAPHGLLWTHAAEVNAALLPFLEA
jgi:non-heme chloroperoxidase